MNELAVFAKYWQAGKVKTRLAREIGAVASSAIYRAFVQCTLQRFRHTAGRRVLVATPAENAPEFEQLTGENWQIEVQVGGDLGTRMRDHFEKSLRRGTECAVLIGSDSPTLPVSIVEMAMQLLQDRQVVLGPTEDGGYYLIGLRGAIPPIFAGIEWSSSSVWQQTIDRLGEAGCRFAELPRWYDVDTFADLQRLRDELTTAANDAQLATLATAIEAALGQTV